MRRSLFLTLFLRILVALILVGVVLFVLDAQGRWGGRELLLAFAGAAVVAVGAICLRMASSMGRALAPLKVMAETMSDQTSTQAAAKPVELEEPGYDDFDGLARAIRTSSARAQE